MNDQRDQVTAAGRSFLAAYQAVGLWRDLEAVSFLALVRARHVSATLEELWAETRDHPAALRTSRHALLCRLCGVSQSVAFAAEDVLAQARQLLADLAWGDERIGPLLEVDGVPGRERRIDLAIGSVRIKWRYSSVAGLIDGLDALLALAGREERFVGLRTEGDDYCYVLVDRAIEIAMDESELFELYREVDPLAGAG